MKKFKGKGMKSKHQITYRNSENSMKSIGRRDFIRYTAMGAAGAGVALFPGWLSARDNIGDIRFKGLSQSPKGKLNTWFRMPAEKWDLGSPLGNGSLGIMAFGDINRERLNVNIDTLYAGGPHPADNLAGPKTLPKINQALLAGRTAEAEKLWLQNIRGDKWFITPYSKLGSLDLTFEPVKEVSNYRRELDIEQAEFRVNYQVEDINWKRQLFVSAPDQIMVKRISTDKKGKVTIDVGLEIEPGCDPEIEIINQDICLKARNFDYEDVEGVLTVATRVRVINSGGEVSVTNNTIRVKNADELIILLAADTSYVNYKKFDKDPVAICKQRIEQASQKSFDELHQNHVKDYQSLFYRFHLDLKGESGSHIPTNERVQRWREKLDEGQEPDDRELITLFSQMARYIWISCSRQGTQPMTVVGLWNQLSQAAWGGVWANNINGPQLYWGVEETNLSELHKPWLQMVTELVENGSQTAKTTFGLPGWAVFLRTDLWRYTSIEAEGTWNAFPQAGPWLCHHLWEHFLFTGDKKFLGEVYPVIKGAAEFYMNYMVRDPKTGNWLAGPSTSPEWGPLALGVTISQMVAWDLFGNCIQAAEILGIDEEFRVKLSQYMENMAALEISGQGHLPEWRLSTDVKAGAREGDNSPNAKFRHMAHMYALSPASQINLKDTPELAAAMRTSLIKRNNDNAPCYMNARRIHAWARFLEAERAYENVVRYINLHTMENLMGSHNQNRNHLHVESNTAFTAGICEMLVQSHAGEIHLLPACPEEWGEGEIRGLRTRGGFEIDMKWEDGTLRKAVIHSTVGGVVRIRTNLPVRLHNAEKQPVAGEVPNPLLKVMPWKFPKVIEPAAVVGLNPPAGYVMQFESEPGKDYILTKK
jgi:alpha-L-fucosidase 2